MMKLGWMLSVTAVLACGGGVDRTVDVDSTAHATDCDPNGVDDLAPGYARIDGCPGSSPQADAATWVEYCATHPEHERCSGSCGDAGACASED